MNIAPYKCLTADPPWPLRDKLPGKGRGAKKHYRLMSVDEICAFPLPPIDDDALLFLWRVASMQEEALRVVRAWGFLAMSEMVWVKTHEKKGVVQAFGATGEGLSIGMGHYVRNQHEVCLIARRKRGRVHVLDHSVRSVFFAPRTRHSEKPPVFYKQVARLVAGPRAELFARARHDGFDPYGDEVAQLPAPESVTPRPRRKREAVGT